jgi:hypothetical protein
VTGREPRRAGHRRPEPLEDPSGVADYIARLTPEDVERIRNDVKELERIGLLNPSVNPPSSHDLP